MQRDTVDDYEQARWLCRWCMQRAAVTGPYCCRWHRFRAWQQIRVNMGHGPQKALARRCVRRHRDRRGRLRKCPAFQRKHADEA